MKSKIVGPPLVERVSPLSASRPSKNLGDCVGDVPKETRTHGMHLPHYTYGPKSAFLSRLRIVGEHDTGKGIVLSILDWSFAERGYMFTHTFLDILLGKYDSTTAAVGSIDPHVLFGYWVFNRSNGGVYHIIPNGEINEG